MAVEKADAENRDEDKKAHKHIQDVETNKEEIEKNREGINWNGQVLQKIAEEMDVRVPPRPVVPD